MVRNLRANGPARAGTFFVEDPGKKIKGHMLEDGEPRDSRLAGQDSDLRRDIHFLPVVVRVQVGTHDNLDGSG